MLEDCQTGVLGAGRSKATGGTHERRQKPLIADDNGERDSCQEGHRSVPAVDRVITIEASALLSSATNTSNSTSSTRFLPMTITARASGATLRAAR